MSLKEFHDAVVARMASISIPEELKRNCNQEFRGYLDGQEGSLYYHWLAAAVAEKKPKVILELGTNRGASAIAMWSTKTESADLITIDIQDCGTYFPYVMERDWGKFHFIIGDDIEIGTGGGSENGLVYIAELELLVPMIDFLFIDTDHRADHFRKEWAIYRDWLADGAIVAVDDINVNDMREAWDELPYEKLDITADCHYSGFGVLRFTR